MVDIFAYPSISRLAEFINIIGSDADLYKSIQTIKFPNEFFSENTESTNEVILGANVCNDITARLEELAKINSVSVYSIYLATYMHLLSELSGKKAIQILSVKDVMESYNPVNIDFDNTTDLFELCRMIDWQISGGSQPSNFTVRDLNGIIVEKGHFLPTFYFEQNRPVLEDKAIEFALEMRNHGSGFKAGMFANSYGLRRDRLEDLLTNYISVLKMIAETV
jgi:hypothetical protein